MSYQLYTTYFLYYMLSYSCCWPADLGFRCWCLKFIDVYNVSSCSSLKSPRLLFLLLSCCDGRSLKPLTMTLPPALHELVWLSLHDCGLKLASYFFFFFIDWSADYVDKILIGYMLKKTSSTKYRKSWLHSLPLPAPYPPTPKYSSSWFGQNKAQSGFLLLI